MTGKTHEKIGFLTPILLTSIYCVKQKTGINFLDIALLTAFSTFGSTLPDIDQTQSKSGRKLPIISYGIKLVNKISKKLKIKRIIQASGHRGITHSFLVWFLLFVLFVTCNQNFHFVNTIVYSVYGLFLGVGTHLLLDMLNPTGIPLFAPVSYINFHILKIRTDSKAEKNLKYILILFMLGFIALNISKLITLNVIPSTISILDSFNIKSIIENTTDKIKLFLK